MKIKDSSIADLHHLRAAGGWLELGDVVSASDELEEIAPETVDTKEVKPGIDR